MSNTIFGINIPNMLRLLNILKYDRTRSIIET